MKDCSICKIKKDLNCFYTRKNRKSGYHSMCIECHKNSAKIKRTQVVWYEKKKEYFLKNPEKYILSRTRQSAKSRNLEFNLTIEDIVIPEYCPILKKKLLIWESPKSRTMMSASVDRLDNTKGYIKGNIQIISVKANLMKNNSTEEELLNFCTYYYNKINLNLISHAPI